MRRNNGVNVRGMCTYVGARGRVASRRDATRRVPASRSVSSRPVPSRPVPLCRVVADGQTAALREITSHARNDHETVTPVLVHLSPPRSSLRGIRVLMSSFLPKCPLADVGQPPVPAVSCFNSRPFAASCSRFREADDHASGRAPVRYTETGTPTSLIVAMTAVACTCTGYFETTNVLFN